MSRYWSSYFLKWLPVIFVTGYAIIGAQDHAPKGNKPFQITLEGPSTPETENKSDSSARIFKKVFSKENKEGTSSETDEEDEENLGINEKGQGVSASKTVASKPAKDKRTENSTWTAITYAEPKQASTWVTVKPKKLKESASPWIVVKKPESKPQISKATTAKGTRSSWITVKPSISETTSSWVAVKPKLLEPTSKTAEKNVAQSAWVTVKPYILESTTKSAEKDSSTWVPVKVIEPKTIEPVVAKNVENKESTSPWVAVKISEEKTLESFSSKTAENNDFNPWIPVQITTSEVIGNSKVLSDTPRNEQILPSRNLTVTPEILPQIAKVISSNVAESTSSQEAITISEVKVENNDFNPWIPVQITTSEDLGNSKVLPDTPRNEQIFPSRNLTVTPEILPQIAKVISSNVAESKSSQEAITISEVKAENNDFNPWVPVQITVSENIENSKVFPTTHRNEQILPSRNLTVTPEILPQIAKVISSNVAESKSSQEAITISEVKAENNDFNPWIPVQITASEDTGNSKLLPTTPRNEQFLPSRNQTVIPEMLPQSTKVIASNVAESKSSQKKITVSEVKEEIKKAKDLIAFFDSIKAKETIALTVPQVHSEPEQAAKPLAPPKTIKAEEFTVPQVQPHQVTEPIAFPEAIEPKELIALTVPQVDIEPEQAAKPIALPEAIKAEEIIALTVPQVNVEPEETAEPIALPEAIKAEEIVALTVPQVNVGPEEAAEPITLPKAIKAEEIIAHAVPQVDIEPEQAAEPIALPEAIKTEEIIAHAVPQENVEPEETAEPIALPEAIKAEEIIAFTEPKANLELEQQKESEIVPTSVEAEELVALSEPHKISESTQFLEASNITEANKEKEAITIKLTELPPQVSTPKEAKEVKDSSIENIAFQKQDSLSETTKKNEILPVLQMIKASEFEPRMVPDLPITSENTPLVPSQDSKIAELEAPSNDTANNEIAQELDRGQAPANVESMSRGPVKTILINFNNVSAVEFIRFISRISGKNFIFDSNDLQFQVTIVSEEPTTLENIMAALLQELRVHNLSLIEQGNNIIIHRNATVNSISTVLSDNLVPDESKKPEIVTRLFRLNTADPDKIAAVIKPLMSEKAIVEIFKDTNHLIVTDIITNVNEIALLVKSLDSPNNGLVIGQYVVRNGFIDSLIQLAQKIMQPITQDQTLIFVPHRSANSIFIVSTPFMMERTIALLQYLDQDQGTTRIFDLKDLKFSDIIQGAAQPVQTTPGGAPVPSADQAGQWVLDENGNWIYRPFQAPGTAPGAQPPTGSWFVDDKGNWRFQAGESPAGPVGPAGVSGPEGYWRLDAQGFWVFQLAQGKSISPEHLVRARRRIADLPLGNIERTQFYIHKLQYRHGDQVATAIARIGQSLRQTPGNNVDLVETIDSVQWIESSNSLIFTGTVDALDKVSELVAEIDTPLRQVFIEMLILETTLDDSLNYGVDWGTRFGGGGFAGSQAHLLAGSPLPIALETTGIGQTPDAARLALTPGYSLGIVGQHLTMGGLRFNSIGALVRAVHERNTVDIVTNPKILTEDNVPAEIFVGINTPYPTQAITNDRGEIITQNFEFRDVGTQLRVTPLIGDNDIITLIIEEEISSIVATPIGASTQGPTTRKSFTRTRVHIPDEFFLVMSGMLQDEENRTRSQVPCLGGVPFLGAGFSNQFHRDLRRNIMIFLRPKIIDTDEEIQNITRHQQDVWKYKKKTKPMWVDEVDDALEFFNLPNQCEDECDDCCKFQNR